MYGCEIWTIKRSWVPGNWCFELWCWRRFLRVPWTARRSNQSILKENQLWIFIGRTDAEAPILWPPDAKYWLRRDPDAGIDWRQEKKGTTQDDGWMASPARWTWVWASSRSWWRTGKPCMPQPMGSRRVICNWATELNISGMRAIWC